MKVYAIGEKDKILVNLCSEQILFLYFFETVDYTGARSRNLFLEPHK